MKKYDKQRLFEVMSRLDKTFKPKLNEGGWNLPDDVRDDDPHFQGPPYEWGYGEPESPRVDTEDFKLHGSIENSNDYLYTVDEKIPHSEFGNVLYGVLSAIEKEKWGSEQYPRYTTYGNKNTYGADFDDETMVSLKERLSQYANVKGIPEFIKAMDDVSSKMEQYEEDKGNYDRSQERPDAEEPDEDWYDRHPQWRR